MEPLSTGNATSNIDAPGRIEILKGVTDPVENKDPLGASSDPTRVNQQAVLNTAVQPRFVNIISQTPINDDGTSAVNRFSLRLGNGVSANNVFNVQFIFTGSTPEMVYVQLYTSFYIDSVAYANAYPYGNNVTPGTWSFERIKQALVLDANASTFTLNNINQDAESLTIRNTTGNEHTVIGFYYWRAILNGGGVRA